MSTPIVPAIIPTSAPHVIEMLQKLQFTNEVQIDLVDGIFDDNVSWPYEPRGDVSEIKTATDNFTIEVDLMVSDAVRAANEWAAIGVDMLIFHIESISLESFKAYAESSYVTIGISMHGDSKLETLIEYAEHSDYIQLMGIKKIGAQGQPFDESIIAKIEELVKRFPNKVISVDGSVNKETIARLKQAGITRFVVGSAIVKQPDYETAFNELNALINA